MLCRSRFLDPVRSHEGHIALLPKIYHCDDKTGSGESEKKIVRPPTLFLNSS